MDKNVQNENEPVHSEELDFSVVSHRAAKLADEIVDDLRNDGEKVTAEAWHKIFDSVYDRMCKTPVQIAQ